MEYFCDAGEMTWFRLVTEAEAEAEGAAMDHAVARYFKLAHAEAIESYVPPQGLSNIEQKIGLKGHIARAMPRFLTLRDNAGTPCVTAMLPAEDGGTGMRTPIIVARKNFDPYV
ncbi:MAG: hypothetical protein AAFZ05_13330, partial [Pseudomonadota bacterium]